MMYRISFNGKAIFDNPGWESEGKLVASTILEVGICKEFNVESEIRN